MWRPKKIPRSVGWLLAVLVLVLVFVAIFLGREQILDGLALLEQVAKGNIALSVAIFIAIYAIGATLTLPIGSLMCLTAGYLFGLALGAVAALAGGLAAATLTFVLVRYVAGAAWRERALKTRAAPVLEILERDAFYYLVLLRTVPAAPFFLINAAAGLTAISGRLYLVATIVGLIPTAVIFAGVGAGVGSLIEAREMAHPRLLLEPEVGLPLAALVVLILTAWAIRRRFERKLK